MKSVIILAVILLSDAAGATAIEIAPGSSIVVKAGDAATVSCSGDVSSGTDAKASINAFCNSSELVLELDTDANTQQEKISMFNSATCKNALSNIKNKMGEFAGLKSLLFCNSSDLIKVRASAVTGKITITTTSMFNAAECQNAL